LSVLPVMKRELRALNPTLALDNAKTLRAVRDASVAKQRFGMMVTGAFAVAALFLATVGLYGVIATGIAQRRKEIGLRMALGASANSVLREMMKEGAVVTALGVAIGIGGAFSASRLYRDQLFEVSATDGSVYGVVAGVTAVVAIVATMVPAWKAARGDPVRALREE
jgi:ABC-type antimicrobial peptide transport system permease subunit